MSVDQQPQQEQQGSSLTPAKSSSSSTTHAPKTPGALTDELSRLEFPIPPQFSLSSNNSNKSKSSGHHSRQQSSVGGAGAAAGLGLPQGTMPGGLEQVGPSAAERREEEQDGLGSDGELADRLANMPLGEPERLSQQASHRRRESVSDQLTDELSRMDFPRPERIFGADDPVSPTMPQQQQTPATDAGRFVVDNNNTMSPTAGGTPRVGVDASEWYSVQLPQGQEIPEAVRKGSLQGVVYKSQQQQKQQQVKEPAADAAASAAAAAT